jgi:two-component system capsular synthesis sensor histidine kinase RcsC
VLVAEDNAPAREFLVEALAALGHRAVVAADGPSALAAAAEARFDAAILDLNLPGLDGIGVARALAALPHRPRLVACSAELLPAAHAAARAAGIDAYLEKPVALAALAAALGPGDPADPGSAASIFERLRAPALAARTRATLRTDFTALVAELRSAHAAGDPAAVARLAHRLRSSALLAADPALADLGRGLEVAADRGEPDAIAAALAAVATRGPPPD